TGLVHSFKRSGVVTGVQIYVPAGVRPASGYTVYFYSMSGISLSKLLPTANIVDGWNIVNFDSEVSVASGKANAYLAAYRTDANYAWSNNSSPFGEMTTNNIDPVGIWSSRTFVNPFATVPMNTKVTGSDDISLVTTKGHLV